MTEKKCCTSCLFFTYHDDKFVESFKVTTQRERYWDEVLTICCRTCNQHSNFMCNLQTHTNVIDDVFIKELEIKLKDILGPAEYNKEKERIKEESEWMKKLI